MSAPRISLFGERAVLIDGIDGPLDSALIARHLEKACADCVDECVSAFDSVVAHLRDGAGGAAAIASIESGCRARGVAPLSPLDQREHLIEVVYDGADLDEVARAARLDVEAVIALHLAGSYVVEVLGFLPGFAYLGGLDARLRSPRRPTPRTRVPAGSVAIAEAWTAIYPRTSPGGWHLLGTARLTTPLFDAQLTPPMWLSAGDRVRFVRIG